MTRRRAFGERLLRLALHLHPPRFRREYRDEMLAYYREVSTNDARAGRRGWFLASSIRAAVVEGLAQRRADRHHRNGHPQSRKALMTGMLSDIRHAWRRLAARKTITLLAVGMLALAIGVTTAMFTVVDALLLRPLPFPHVDRLAHVVLRTENTIATTVSTPVFRAWRGASLFERLEGATTGTAVVAVPGTLEERESAFVSPGLLDMLGARPLAGRLFADTEGRDGTDDAVLLSERLWRGAFGADPSLIGRRVRIDDQPITVVGVLPDTFRFPNWSTDLWRPLDYLAAPQARSGDDPSAYVLFHEDAPREEALRRALDLAKAAAPDLVDAPGMNSEMRADVWPIAGLWGGSYLARATPFLAGGVVLVFLVLCANVTSLLLAQVGGRVREFGMCAALGASRARLLRQAFVESTLVGVFGIGAGIAAAWVFVGLVRAWLPEAFLLQTLNPLDLDLRALALASTAGGLATIGIAMLPAWIGTRADATATARAGREQRGGTETRLARVCTRSLLVGEIALASALVAGTVLLVVSFLRLADIDRGLDTAGVVTGSITLTDAQQGPALLSALREQPGVTDATLSYGAGPRGWFSHYGDGFEPERPGNPKVELRVRGYQVSADYFPFYGIDIVRGRAFGPDDAEGAAIISEGLAARLFPDQEPIGQGIRWSDRRYHVVGVASEIRYPSLEGGEEFVEFYEGLRPRQTVTVSLRCEPACDNLALVRQTLLSTGLVENPWRLEVMERQYADRLATPRAAATLATVFAAVAVTAAAGGLFSVLTYAVGRRRREFGIRASLGARPVELQTLILREGLRLAIAGLFLGGFAAWGLSAVLASVIYDVDASEPWLWASMAAVIVATTLVACWVPARRAAGVDPASLLHES